MNGYYVNVSDLTDRNPPLAGKILQLRQAVSTGMEKQMHQPTSRELAATRRSAI